MAQTQLITAQEFAQFRNISKKIDEDKINEAILQAQQTDLVNILGDFYFDVLRNANETSYGDLMNGSEFEYCNEDFEHAGIKALLADYVSARYVYKRNVNDTAFGMVGKNYQDGIPTERNTIKDLSKQDQIDAGAKFIYIEKYILSKPDLFSRYCKNKRNETSFNQIRYSRL